MSPAPIPLRLSPAEILEAAGPELDALLSVPARARLVAGATKLPIPARTVCLECRLDDDDRVDLALCLAAHTTHLEEALEALGKQNADDPRWRRCTQLLVRWASGRDTALGGVPFLFTAFDLASDLAALPVPCLSVCADPSFFMRRVGLPVPRAPRAWPLQLLDICCASLGIDEVTPAVRKRARGCLAAVEDTEVRQLSLMLAREPVTLKFDLTIPSVELAAFLRVNGWAGDVARLSEQLSFLAPWQERVQLNFVVNAPSEPAASLEVELFGTGPLDCDIEQRGGLLARLVSSGLARADKASALLRILHRPISVTGDRWVARNWYLKLRFDDGRFCAAKVYVGLMQRSALREAALAEASSGC